MQESGPGKEFIRSIDPPEDGRIFTMIFSGGMVAAEISRDKWRLVPRLVDSRPSVTGHYTKSEIQRTLREHGFRFTAFKSIDIIRGEQTSHWVPFIRGKTNFSIGPRDHWGNVANNLGRARTQHLLTKELSWREADAIIDAAGDIERLAGSIQSSLRNLDTAVEYLCEFYHQELINHLAANRTDGAGISTTRDQAFFAAVQSFFLHLGAARDYLGAFVAAQLGKGPKIDAMARLIEVVRASDFENSAVLRFLREQNLIVAKGDPSAKFEATGWLKLASELRNEFVHRRTYGQKQAERMGRIRVADSSMGLYKYHRNIVMPDIPEGTDVLDIVLDSYEMMNCIQNSCAKLSGHNTDIRTFNDRDVTLVSTPK